MWRLFFGVTVIPNKLLLDVITRLKHLGPGLRPIPERNLHVTLRFLGDCDPDRIPEFTEWMTQAARGVDPEVMKIQGIGVFPDLKRPKVLWCGIECPGIITIAQRLEQAAIQGGFPKENRAYTPHLTLAYLDQSSHELFELIHQNQAQAFGTHQFDRIQLFRSELLETGPQYSLLSEVKFHSSGGEEFTSSQECA